MKTVINNINISHEPPELIYSRDGGEMMVPSHSPASVDLGLLMDNDAVYELSSNLRDKRYDISDIFPGKVVVKCQHCGQWCARKTACVYCGAPVD